MRFRTMLTMLGAGLLAACGVNSVPTAEENVNAKWGEVQNQYQRRADLVPNLVATVKGYAAHESGTLTKVTEARARATSINITTDDLSDPQQFEKFSQAQNQLTQALGQLRTVVEAYPQLTANQNFMALQSQLEGTENRIAIARRDYNEAVQAYNTRIRTFPDAVGARIFYGAKPKVPFQAQAGAETAPTVNFGNAS
ncbi:MULTISPECIES: LemA family protein [Sphingomonas]|uniref:LemA family protein n=1 Tax=Sphingomonas molluscorum TaxID=418184 RepID=A0ABU8Q1X7_9SPHN|nr:MULTISPECIES: LemA family protein [unclassified Sphingomonas]MBM7405170.1 LemA protein [Sphingomonas sp. JUb134]MCG7349178.1 LemA family protein [Sphingomonas sp. ACRSK]RSV14284.1 LemA family protein [Sphingomonas sp. ABOLF]GLK21053.1 LemA protein [Microbacterium terregens]